MKRSTVTLRDVARQVGVHASTISRALNPDVRYPVEKTLAARIGQVAEEMGYEPNHAAVGLKLNRSYFIAALVPDISDPALPPLVVGIRERLAGTRYVAVLGDADRAIGNERRAVGTMRARPIDGVILGTARREDALVAELVAQDMRLALVDRVTDVPECSTVTHDLQLGMAQAVDHLVELGHRRIAHLAAPAEFSTGTACRRGFETALGRAGLGQGPTAVADGFDIEAGARAAYRLLEAGERFTAVVAANDLLALGCIDALAERGLRCPGEISVTGVGGVPFLDRMTPPLTTLRTDRRTMGARAADLLLAAIDRPDAPVEHVVLAPELVVRGSTAPPAARHFAPRK